MQNSHIAFFIHISDKPKNTMLDTNMCRQKVRFRTIIEMSILLTKSGKKFADAILSDLYKKEAEVFKALT